jgi:hypothetical protein
MTDFPPVPPDSPSPAVPAPSSPPPAPAPAAQVATGPRTSTLAVISLVSGLLTWISLPFFYLVIPTPVCVIAAIVCGHLARREIRRDPTMAGDGLAIGGLVLGWAMVAMCLLAVIAIVVFGAAILSAIGLSANLG